MSIDICGNASFAPEITDLLKEITDDITKAIIKDGNPIVVLEHYRWVPEVLSLWAKQVNLCDSCILLLENGMEQEAYLLARSQFNNMLWIKYICDGEGDERVKEYFHQPNISQIMHNKNLIKLLKEFDDYADDRFDKTEMIEKLEEAIEENEKILSQNNIDNKLKSIAELSKQTTLLFSSYLTMYNNASKFEHSDMSTIRKYRKKVLEGYSKEQIFTIDLNTSDRKDWFNVLHYSMMSLFQAFDSFTNRIINKDNHLLLYPENNPAYSQADFDEILLKFKLCMAMMEKEMPILNQN